MTVCFANGHGESKDPRNVSFTTPPQGILTGP